MKKVVVSFLFWGIVFHGFCEKTVPAAVREKVKPRKLLVYKVEKNPFLICKYNFDLEPNRYSRNKDLKDYPVKTLKIFLRKKIRDHIRVFPLYPVFDLNELAEKDKFECIFLLPPVMYDQLKEYGKDAKIIIRASTGNSYNSIADDRKIIVEFSSDAAEAEKLQALWKRGMKRHLLANLSNYEDTEFETLLYMRLFNSVPEQKPDNWKKNDLAKLLFTFSGLNDIRDAVPLDRNGEPLMEPYDQIAPKPLMLPQVNVAKTETEPGLAKWVPRSCYYIEWKDFANFTSTLYGLADIFDKWSPGTYPLSGRQIVDGYLKKAGLKDNGKLTDNIESIALAGWDFYFQSGTSFLLVIKTRTPVEKMPDVPFVSSPEKNIIVLSTSEKLYKMALSTYAKGRSLSQLNNFAYSRKRLSRSKDEKELAWLYLSDYWLTNFISPRWMILNNRLAQLDSRLRFVDLLRICRMFETASDKLPGLDEVKSSPFLADDMKKWLFAGLVEKDGAIKDEKLGSLYNHPPIDALHFDKVSKSEAVRYNRFKQLYTRRWKQIDPIAFQLTETEDGVYKTRLYISPISNRSDFRSIRSFAPKQKIKHMIRKIDGSAFAVSVAVATPALKPFLRNITLPVNMFVQLVGFDFAPSSYSPASWLEPMRAYDRMSYLRIPAAVSIPTLVFDALRGMAGRINLIPSDYEKIDKVLQAESGGFSLMVLKQKEAGINYLGLDPSTLIRIRDNASNGFIEDSVPCDIRLYLNLINAYQLRRKIWFEALKNRGMATWRRENRIFRIRQFLNSISGNIKNNLISNNINKLKLFPTAGIVDLYGIPQLRNTSDEGRRNYSSFVLKRISKLPEVLLRIIQIDAFISVEDNALFFETQFRLKKAAGEPRKAQTGSSRQPAAQNTTTLDFDD